MREIVLRMTFPGVALWLGCGVVSPFVQAQTAVQQMTQVKQGRTESHASQEQHKSTTSTTADGAADESFLEFLATWSDEDQQWLDAELAESEADVEQIAEPATGSVIE